MPVVSDATPANWYPDPDAPSRLRYWDGFAWTAHYAPMPPLPAAVTGDLASLLGPGWGAAAPAVPADDEGA